MIFDEFLHFVQKRVHSPSPSSDQSVIDRRNNPDEIKAEWILENQELKIVGLWDPVILNQNVTDFVRSADLTEHGVDAIIKYGLTDFDLGRVERLAHEEKTLSQLALGLMYLKGYLADESKGRYWLTRSAENGDGESQFLIAAMYEEGSNGFPHDLSQASRWYYEAIHDPQIAFSSRGCLSYF